MFHALVVLLILLAAFALIWWGISRLALPEPIKTVVLVIIGLIALVFIYQLVGGHSFASF
jgi:divalent metal cation (Fe/Co/Zn/Cd) transporter